jgi:outer membrane protein insertion porin family
MARPMTVNQVNVHGATNIRRGFLNPIFEPLVAGRQNSPSTVGEVMATLQTASAQLSGLRMFIWPFFYEPPAPLSFASMLT